MFNRIYIFAIIIYYYLLNPHLDKALPRLFLYYVYCGPAAAGFVGVVADSVVGVADSVVADSVFAVADSDVVDYVVAVADSAMDAAADSDSAAAAAAADSAAADSAADSAAADSAADADGEDADAVMLLKMPLLQSFWHPRPPSP